MPTLSKHNLIASSHLQIARSLGLAILNEDGHVGLRIISNSMKPWIKPGDIVLLQSALTEKLRIGDIITYQSGNILITHRIININKESITTRGDRNNKTDAPVAKGQIIGLVTSVRRDNSVHNYQNRIWLIVNRIIGYYGFLISRLLNFHE